MSTVNWSLQHKRDTAANWTSNNPTLLAGQLGIETDGLTTTPKFKIGDGSSTWTALPYFYGGSASAQDLQNVLTVGNSSGNLSAKFGTGTIYFGATNQVHVQYVSGIELHNTTANTLVNLGDTGRWKVDAVQYMPNLSASSILSLDANKEIVTVHNTTGSGTTIVLSTSPTIYTSLTADYASASTLPVFNGTKQLVSSSGSGFVTVSAGVVSYDTNTYLTTSAAALAYQPLDSDLTSWSGVTRASGFDTFTATPSSANLSSLLTDKTGTGVLVFGTSPTFTTDITTPKINGVSGNLLLTNAAQTSGAITNFTFTNSANTGQTASTEISNFKVNGATKTWAAGAITTQRWNYFTANTAAFASASTIAESYGLYVEAATAGSNATITNNFALGLIAGTATLKFGNLTGSTSSSAIYMNQATPSSSNFTIQSDGSNTTINTPSASGTFSIQTGAAANRFQIAGQLGAGAFNGFTFTAASNTGQTASTEINGYLYNSYSRQWATGAITTQRERYYKSVTYSFVGASTITNAYGAYFEAPTAGTNATITNNYALGGNGSFLFSDGTRSLAYTLAANSVFTNTGDTSSQIKTVSGTRSINIQSYAGDVNYIDAANNTLRIRTTTNNSIELWTNGTSRLGISTASLTFSDSFNITFNATTGTKIGTATSEKLSFWNATPIVQPTTAVVAATFVANTSGIANDTATFDGYTIGQVVKALRNAGLLA